MSLIDALRYRLRVLLHPDAYGRELEREVEHHLDLESAHQLRGERDLLTPHDARRRAMREFGNVTYATEERRIVSGVSLFDALRQDVQFVFRVLRRRPVFAVVTVATLALGVGAATSIFSIADVVLFRPLAFPDPGRLIAVSKTQPELKDASYPRGAMGPDWILASRISRLARGANILRRTGDLEQQHERCRRDRRAGGSRNHPRKRVDARGARCAAGARTRFHAR